ncbi:hydantoinase/oxoprolinase family protein [Rhodococcus sp. 2H158]
MAYAIGVDIGGTFTDCVAVDTQGNIIQSKVPSTHASSPDEGVIAGVQKLAEAAGREVEEFLADTEAFGHGTTIGTNLVVERLGARVGLVATAGHGDALLMMRGRGRTAGIPKDKLLSVRDTDKPDPLVPREHVVEVVERVTKDGSVLVPLDEQQARNALRLLLDQDIEAVAVALMWSFRNPTHEQRIRELIHEIRPDIYVSISSEIAPRIGEYERTVATVINSYVGPRSSRYLKKLESELQSRGLDAPAFIMQSNGGVAPLASAVGAPVKTIGSGPVGGLTGTASIAARLGHRNVIATDMGGTSFEVGLIIEGSPLLVGEQVIEQYTYRVPQLDVRSIACGGGSIAQVDHISRGIRVGPESAGSYPGPACYGAGTLPTVTDADVVLGLIDPDQFLGGQMKLDRTAAEAAVQRLADELGMSLEETAAGILKVNSFAAATLIRQRTLEQGLDPRDFMVYAFGGAGPVHAFAFAHELGARGVLIPLGNGASTLSAYGIAVTDAKQIFEEECSIKAPFDVRALQDVCTRLENRAVTTMTEGGFAPEDIRLERTALARYAEQYMQELPLPLPEGGVSEESRSSLESAFAAEYARLYGATAVSGFQQVEIFSVRVIATAVRHAGALESEPYEAGGGAAVSAGTREIFWPDEGRWVTTDVYDAPPAHGLAVHGPAVVQLPHTTISVPPGQFLETDRAGNCVLTRRKELSA